MEDYKAQIKATLLSNNMIRGQPRTSLHSASPSSAHPISPPPIVPSQSYPSRPSSTASHPGTRPTMNHSNSDFDARYVDPRHSRQTAMAPPISSSVHRRSYHGPSPTGLSGFEPQAPQPNYHHLSASYSDPNLAALDLTSLYSPNSFPSASTLSTPETLNYDPLSFGVPSFPFEPQPQNFSPVSTQNTVQHDHVLYYFEHVRKMQFIFARGNLVTNTIFSVSARVQSFRATS